MVHAIFYMHQTSGASAGMCVCDRTHQLKKTAIVSQRKRNVLSCFNEKVQINDVKMETLSIHLPLGFVVAWIIKYFVKIFSH